VRDADIRSALHRYLSKEYEKDPETLIIDELGLCEGEARVDIAVVNGILAGYEIKSDRDTLERLAHQTHIYSSVLDQVVIVVAPRHLEKVVDLVPEWWGIWEALKDSTGIRIESVRSPRQNPCVDPAALVQLLWRNEALDILKSLGAERGMLSKPRWMIWERLVELVPASQLRNLVREQLKRRTNWRSDRPQKRDGGRYRRVAK